MTVEQLRALYLDLMRKCLTGLVYDDPAMEWSGVGTRPFDRASREKGTDWPAHAQSMTGTPERTTATCRRPAKQCNFLEPDRRP